MIIIIIMIMFLSLALYMDIYIYISRHVANAEGNIDDNSLSVPWGPYIYDEFPSLRPTHSLISLTLHEIVDVGGGGGCWCIQYMRTQYTMTMLLLMVVVVMVLFGDDCRWGALIYNIYILSNGLVMVLSLVHGCVLAAIVLAAVTAASDDGRLRTGSRGGPQLLQSWDQRFLERRSAAQGALADPSGLTAGMRL